MSAHAANWGIADAEVATLWPQTIRILFVIDGRIRLTKAADAFGLGYVLDTLRAPFAWWVRFEVDVARRDDFDGVEPLTYRRFKFTDAGFNLDAYDQLWFFADLPNIDDGADDAMTDADICNEFALSHAELKLVAEWMDRGGGVFATGDHTLLGASMCSRIPRVGTMRRWTYE